VAGSRIKLEHHGLRPDDVVAVVSDVITSRSAVT
jgi:hypothetical protein